MVAAAVYAAGGVVGIFGIFVLQLERTARYVHLTAYDRLEEALLDRLDLPFDALDLVCVRRIGF